ncbi:substrate-binding domain-containing protein, partial [Vibrio sp.]|nr:substrate-binding domain-containing protein [Vibrio sp.]
GVSPKTAQKVISAAKELGINRVLPEVYQAPWKVEVILSKNPSHFFKYLTASFTKLVQAHQYRNIRLRCTLMPEDQPEKLASHLRNSADRYDGIIVFANDNDAVYEALSVCHDKGTPVITLATDLPKAKRLCHVGIDQYQMGRTAGSLMSKMIREEGKIIVISGRFDYQAHIQRMDGFHTVMAKHNKVEISDIYYGNDERDTIRGILEAHNRENIIGIYNSGAGNKAVGEWLSKHNKTGKCPFITHELYPTTESLLKDQNLYFTLDQNAQRHAELSLNIMFNHLANNFEPHIYQDGKVSFSIFTEENIE